MIVTELSLAAVKGTRLRTVESVSLGEHGARGDRRFFVIDGRGRMVNGKLLGTLSQVVAELQGDDLALRLPGGQVVRAPVAVGEPVKARFHSRMREGRIVGGPFAAALSELCGQPLQLVQAAGSGADRGAGGGVTLISRASLAGLATEAGMEAVDARRFRMLVEIDGVPAHGEDGWVGETVSVGEARVRFAGHVGRCLVTSRHPESGVVDLPTLDVLRGYRGAVEATEPLPFGVYGKVVAPGTVRVGDRVALVD